MALDTSPTAISTVGGAAEGLLGAMFESADVLAGVFELFEQDYRYLLVNRATAAFYGRTPEEMAGRTGRDMGVDPAQIALRLTRLWSCWNNRRTETSEYPFEHGGVAGWFLGTFTPLPGDQPRVSFVLVDITARKTAELEVEREHRRLATALDATGLGLWEYDIGADEIFCDARSRELFGLGPDEAVDFALYKSRIHPADAAALADAHEAALAGANGGRYSVEHRTTDRAGAVRWCRGSGQVVFDPEGRPTRIYGTTLDISAEVEARERQALLMGELNHRVKNNLATVQSMALQAARTAPDLATFVRTFEGRIVSLARTHDVLTANAWTSASLLAIVAREMESLGEQVEVNGPDVNLAAGEALAIGLIVHELASNASKYGALSAAGGRVAVSWSCDASGLVAFEWREAGGPPVATPQRHGFGTRLIRRLSEGDLAGRLTTEFAPQGLQVRLAFRPAASSA
jgi:PAS domain S-box-containing protein